MPTGRPWLFDDYPRYAATFLRVKHPDYGTLVPLKLKPIQQRINEAIDAQLATGRPARVQILKFRRGGVSTVIAGKFFHRVVTRGHQRGQVIAHRRPDAEVIFSIYERMYEHLPERWRDLRVRPTRVGGRRKMLAFPRLGSELEVTSAQAIGSGRGGDLQLLHLSEAPFFPEPEEFLAGIMPQVPATGDSIVALEGTSSGPQTWWHETWQQAKDGANGFQPLFFAWQEDPWTRLRPGLSPEEWTDEEQELATRYAVDGEQLAWLRYQLDVTCFGNVNRRRREFPSSEEDAWVSVGDVAWGTEALLPCYQRRTPLWHGTLTKAGIEKDPEGSLAVWEEPQARADYVIGVDVAAGLEEGNLCVGSVWRVGRQPGQWPVQVAEWAGRQDPVTFAETLTLLGHYYQKALLAVEVTGIGRPTQTALQKTFFYPRLHRWRRPDAYKASGDTWGWETTWKSKQLLHGIADWLFRTRHVTMRSPWLMEELLNYQQVSPDEYKGVKGDDRIMAAMIAWVSWFENVFPGVPLKELRPTLVRLYGAATPMEHQVAQKPIPEDDQAAWLDPTNELDAGANPQAWRSHRRRTRDPVEADW